MTLFLRGIGHAHPKNVVTNAFLSGLGIGTDEEWILSRVGVRERRTILPLGHIQETKNLNVHETQGFVRDGADNLVREAAKMALERANLRAEQVGLVISGGCTPTRMIPSDASTYANILGIKAPCLDIHAACSSWVAQAHMLGMLGAYQTVMTINCEIPTAYVSYADRRNCVLVGDGCVVTLWDRREGSFRVHDTAFESDPTGAEKVTLGHTVHFDQDGPSVQKFAVTRMAQVYETLRGLDSAFIGHQANARALDSVENRCEITHTYRNIERFGNTFSAGVPSVLSEQFYNEALRDVVVTTVGSGLAWGGVRLIRE